MSLTRRDFLVSAGVAIAGATVMARTPWQRGATAALTDAEVDALFDRSLVIDSLSADERWQQPDAIFEAYKKSGLAAIHTTLAYSSFAVAQRDLAAWEARFKQWPDRFFKMLHGADIAEAKRTKRIAVLLGFQNGAVTDNDVKNLDAIYAAGGRCIQLTYNEHNLIGDGCTQKVDGGLSPFGHQVVERMNQLGILVDLSHCGLVTSRDGIAASKKPPAFTHTFCKSIYDHVRGKPDDMLKAMADKGGMIGIMTLGYMVGPGADTSIEDYLNHIDRAVKVAGIDHVGIASDYSIRGIEPMNTRESWYVPRLTAFPPEYRVRWPPWIAGLDGPERFRNIAHGLAKRGYSSAALEKILGANWVRFFTDALG